MVWKIESPKSCRLRIIFTSGFVMVLANVIRRWFAQFCNSFDIMTKTIKNPTHHPTGPHRRTVSALPTIRLHQPPISSWSTGWLHFWLGARTGVVCTSPGPVSNTSSELTKPESPSAPTRTLYAVPGIRPFNPKTLREPFTISLLHSSLPMEILQKQHIWMF